MPQLDLKKFRKMLQIDLIMNNFSFDLICFWCIVYVLLAN